MKIAVLGATGVVGREIMRQLYGSSLPIQRIEALASSRSAGQVLPVAGRDHVVVEAEAFDFSDVDLVLSSAGRERAARYLPRAVEGGAWVIDNSSQFRMCDDVPLVIPEVNGDLLAACEQPCIIANPNCAAIQLVMALDVVRRCYGLRRVIVATYQGKSGAGQAAVRSFHEAAEAAVSALKGTGSLSAQPFDVCPVIGEIQEDGHSFEEAKIIEEIKKMLGLQTLPVLATAVRVPVETGHSASVTVETEQPVNAGELRRRWSSAPGMAYLDGAVTPVQHAVGVDEVTIGRLRLYDGQYASFWCVGDNLRKGAATNAVQIAKCLYERGLLSVD